MCVFRVIFMFMTSKLFSGGTDLIFVLDLSDYSGRTSTSDLQQIKYWLMNISTGFSTIFNLRVGVITYEKTTEFINQ